MSVLLLPGRFARQPSGTLTLDPANQLTRGIVAAIVPVGGKLYDIVNRVWPTTFGAAPAYGMGVAGEGVRAAGGGYVFTHAIYAASSHYTAVLNAQLSAVDAAGFSGMFAISDGAGSVNFMSLQRSGTGSNIRIYQGNDSVDSFPIANLIDGRNHTLVISSEGVAKRDVELDGVAHTTAAGGTAAPTQATGKLVLWGERNASAATGSDGVIHAFLLWNRKLSPAERRMVGINPWQVFTPPQRRIWVSSGAPTGYELDAEAASFALTGNAAGLRVSRSLSAEAGTFALTGAAANLLVGHRLGTDAAAFALAGQPAVLRATRRLVAAAGTFALTGSDAGLSKSTGYTLQAEAATFALTGGAVGLKRAARLVAATGSLALTGIDAALRKGYALLAAGGAYSLAGQEVSFRRGYALSAAPGSFSLEGAEVTLTWSGAPVPLVYARVPAGAESAPRMSRPPSVASRSRPAALSTARRRN